MFFLPFILPNGETVVFFDRGFTIVALFFILTGIIFFVFQVKDKNFKLKRSFEYPQLKDFFLILLPMSPVVGYVFSNLEYLNIIGFLYIASITLLFTLTLSFILPIFFSYFASYRTLMISGIAISFTTLIMPSITENPNNHIFNSQFVTQGTYLILSFLVLYLTYTFNKTIAYTLTIVFMFTGTLEIFFNFFFK